MDISQLNKKELLELIKSYNNYVITASEEGFLMEGWQPVSIYEYYDNEYQLED